MHRSTVNVAQFPDSSRLNPILGQYKSFMTREGVAFTAHTMYPNPHGKPRVSFRWLWAHRRTLDVIHLHWFQRLYFEHGDAAGKNAVRLARFLVWLGAARILGIGLTWTAHNLYPHEVAPLGVDWFVRQLITRLARVVFVDSETARLLVAQEFPWIKRLVIAPQGNFLTLYPPGAGREKTRAHWDIPQDAFVFLTFGLIRAYKGVTDLLDVFTREFPEDHVHLVIAGDAHDGQTRRQLEALAAGHSRIHLHLRFIPDDEVHSIFAASDVVVLPFEHIFTSSTALLSNSMGKLTVLPAVGALPENHEGQFIRYRRGDPHALAQAMKDSMLLPYQQLGISASQRMVQRSWHFTGKIMADALRSLRKTE